MTTVHEPARDVPVLCEADVIVVGGGPAGIGASLAAARNGAKTVLVEHFGHLGGMQTLCFHSNFPEYDPAIHSGIIVEILDDMRQAGEIVLDTSDITRKNAMGGQIQFDVEYYKFLLDDLTARAGVKVVLHSHVAGVMRTGNRLDGIFIENVEGRQAVQGKVVIDCTGSGEVSWKAGAPCLVDAYPKGSKKGRHTGIGYSYYLKGVDGDRYRKYREAHLEDWGGISVNGRYAAERLVHEAKAAGTLYGNHGFSIIVRDYGMAWVLAPQYPFALGQHCWKIEDLTAGEIDLRRQAWSGWKFLKDNLPGFEKSHIEKTPVYPRLGDGHRLMGEYVLIEADIRNGEPCPDSVAISNSSPDIHGPDDEHDHVHNAPPHDIPYRCLVSREIENLMCAGSASSYDFVVWASERNTTTSMCTGQAAGTAAAIAAGDKTNPKRIDVKKLQATLRAQGVRTSVAELPEGILEEYREKAEKANKLEEEFLAKGSFKP